MKGQIKVTTPAAYLANVDASRRADITQLDTLIRKSAPSLTPFIYSGMLGYGPYHYRYATGREGDAARIALASNASYISLYALAADIRGYVAERYKARLPKASIGKSCIRFKRLSDLDVGVLRELIEETAQMAKAAVDTSAAASQKPVAKKPVTKKAAAKKPVAKKPAATKPAASKPAAKNPVTKKAPAKKAVSKKPSAK